MRVIIGSDHAGFELKEKLKKHLISEGHVLEDAGASSDKSCDYPEYAEKLSKLVLNTGDKGILICGTGIGMCMAANKFKGIRAALCYDECTARAAREHNDANVLCLGGRTTSLEDAKKITGVFLKTRASPEKRHRRRIKKISRIEKNNFK